MINFLKRIKNNFSALINPGKSRKKTRELPRLLSLTLTFRQGRGKVKFQLPGRSDWQCPLAVENSGLLGKGTKVKLYLKSLCSEQSLELIDFTILFRAALPEHSRMMINGFHPWNRSEELGLHDRVSAKIPFLKSLFSSVEEDKLFAGSAGPGYLRSFSYTFFRFLDDRVFFIGSLNEKSGFTLFDYNFDSDDLIIRKDCRGAIPGSDYELLNLYYGFGKLEELLEEYRGLLNSMRPSSPQASVWCCRLNSKESQSIKVVREALTGLTEQRLPLNYFLIDQGWTKFTGDWLEKNDQFPLGMRALGEEIRAAGFRPGLWLAPLVCAPGAELCKKHPDWLLRDKRGRIVKTGSGSLPEEYFFILNITLPEVRVYLKDLLEIVQQQWGFELLKLDYLHAAAFIEMRGQTGGQVIGELVEFLDQLTREAVTIGNGVPPGSAFGHFDYVQVSSNDDFTGPGHRNSLTNYAGEVPEEALVSLIGRRHLDRRMFRNAAAAVPLVPDHHYNRTILSLNLLLGGLITVSDRGNLLMPGDQNQLLKIFPLSEAEITGHDSYDGLHHFEFTLGEKDYLLYANLTPRKRTIKLPRGLWYNEDLFLVRAGTNLVLEPYQSLIFYQTGWPTGSNVTLLGASGHLFPGAQILRLQHAGPEIKIARHPHSSGVSTVSLAVPGDELPFRVNGIPCQVSRDMGIDFLTFRLAQEREEIEC